MSDRDGKRAGDGDERPPADGAAVRSRTDADDPVTVVAQGTFDLVHPGHVHYLEEAAAFGDELHVIVARRANVTHKARPVLPDRQRRDVVAAFGVVDEAHLGHESDIFVPVEEIDPDVVVLGYDQHHDVSAIEAALGERGIDCRVERAGPRERRYEDELLSTGDIVDRILDERRSGER